MYSLNVREDFIAQHYLTVPNCGPENEWHSHHFTVEVELEGETLNENGYLTDIVEVEDALETLIDRYQDTTLNDLAEFDGLNPSVEHFARIFWTRLHAELSTEPLDRVTVRIWEDDSAWASYSE